MVDKIGWTEPLYSGGVLEFATKRVVRGARCGARIDEWRRRMGIVAGVPEFPSGRNDYDRGLLEGQRRARAQVRPLRQA